MCPCRVNHNGAYLCVLLTPAQLQLVRETRRQQEAVERDCSGLMAQEQRFRDEISRKQQQVWNNFFFFAVSNSQCNFNDCNRLKMTRTSC